MNTYLSLTALPDNTPPYARLTVLRFLASLDLLYSAGLKCGICSKKRLELKSNTEKRSQNATNY